MGRAFCCCTLPPNKKILGLIDTYWFMISMLLLSSIYCLILMVWKTVYFLYIGPIFIPIILFYITCFVIICLKKKDMLEWMLIIDRVILVVLFVVYIYYICNIIIIDALCKENCSSFFVDTILLNVSYVILVIADLSLNQYDSSFNLYEEESTQNPEQYRSMNTVNQA